MRGLPKMCVCVGGGGGGCKLLFSLELKQRVKYTQYQ